MSKVSRIILVAVLLLFTWMILSGWETDGTRARAVTAMVAGFMLILAAGLIAPNRLRVAFRIVAAMVALTEVWYFVSEVLALLHGQHQTFKLGQPSAIMAGLALLIFGVPAFIFALGGVTVGWVDRLLRRARGVSDVDDRAS